MSFSLKVLRAVNEALECNNFEDPYKVMEDYLVRNKASHHITEARCVLRNKLHEQRKTIRNEAAEFARTGRLPHGIGPSGHVSSNWKNYTGHFSARS